ncbi:Pc21g03000 [Penicillium rubens Wisconsin 54-1255]|uniref:Pc21g03000 protein n=2 Tax=Penicillium chrysogenum species complex TaxID=254878 RepID=B6HKP8_PENRW|nr:Pc21g03000 [Penicillium rubens Wisconsin 54-1255]
MVTRTPPNCRSSPPQLKVRDIAKRGLCIDGCTQLGGFLQSAQTCNVLCLISRRTYKLYLVTSGFPFYFEIPNYILSHPPNLQLNPLHTMRDTPSKFIEILDPKDSSLRMSDSDVRLEDVLADHEATINSRARSSTQSSAKPDKPPSRRNSTSPTPRWKRLSNILGQPRRNS